MHMKLNLNCESFHWMSVTGSVRLVRYLKLAFFTDARRSHSDWSSLN